MLLFLILHVDLVMIILFIKEQFLEYIAPTIDTLCLISSKEN